MDDIYSALFKKFEDIAGERLFRTTILLVFACVVILGFWHVFVPYVVVPVKQAVSGYHKISSYEADAKAVINELSELENIGSSLIDKGKECLKNLDRECMDKVKGENAYIKIRQKQIQKRWDVIDIKGRLYMEVLDYIFAILLIIGTFCVFYIIKIIASIVLRK